LLSTQNSATTPSIYPLEQLVAHASAKLPSKDDQTSSESDTSDGEAPQNTFQVGGFRAASRCIDAISHPVSMLMQLTPTLEAIYTHKYSAPLREHAFQTTLVTPGSFQYISHVRDKFPEADPEIINRLGEANWQRHQRIRNLAVNDASEVTKVDPAISLFKPRSLFQDSALGSSLPTISGPAKSDASHRSFASSANTAAGNSLRVPEMPITALGEAFKCPFCLTLISCSSRIQWK
jgi:hypothetical protein